jgi:hypothetical protein
LEKAEEQGKNLANLKDELNLLWYKVSLICLPALATLIRFVIVHFLLEALSYTLGNIFQAIFWASSFK